MIFHILTTGSTGSPINTASGDPQRYAAQIIQVWWFN